MNFFTTSTEEKKKYMFKSKKNVQISNLLFGWNIDLQTSYFNLLQQCQKLVVTQYFQHYHQRFVSESKAVVSETCQLNDQNGTSVVILIPKTKL